MSLLLVYLGLLGGIRRWLIPDFGWTGLDPLILVMPALAVLPFLGLALQRRVPRDTPTAKLMFWLVVMMCLQIFNPLQGGLLVGVGGALFYIVPLMWYYMGRKMGSLPLLHHLLHLTVFISVVGAVYGLKQNFLGLSDSETQWLHLVGNMQMIDSTTTRAFSFFTASGEYVDVAGNSHYDALGATFLEASVWRFFLIAFSGGCPCSWAPCDQPSSELSGGVLHGLGGAGKNLSILGTAHRRRNYRRCRRSRLGLAGSSEGPVRSGDRRSSSSTRPKDCWILGIPRPSVISPWH